MDHTIDGTELVSKRRSKVRFREFILLAFGYCCAYCAEPLGRNPTLDHVHPKAKGGLTTRDNLIACCFNCNGRKGATTDWKKWYRRQQFWSEGREMTIEEWLEH